MFEEGGESMLFAATREQARIVWRQARDFLSDDPAYRFADSSATTTITHIATRTRVRVMSSNAKGAFGLLRTPWAILDEPGAYEKARGELLWDAVATAVGKPDSRLKVLIVGTLAPAHGGWWPELVEAGSQRGVYVQALQGRRDRWQSAREIMRVNPLSRISPEFRRQLLIERDEALGDQRKKARFLSYRLNLPTADESTVLLTVDDWQRVLARPVAPRQGRPIVAVDLGASRAWSAAVAVWESGRCEALAICPGIPEVFEQEKRDRVPRGTYARLVESGELLLCTGKRVPPVEDLWRAIVEAWGVPVKVVCDRLRIGELRDAVPAGLALDLRKGLWSEANEDIGFLRRVALDGPLTVAEGRDLLTTSLAVALVVNDAHGNTKMRKADPNRSRDDVAAALVLAAGAFVRAGGQRAGPVYLGAI